MASAHPFPTEGGPVEGLSVSAQADAAAVLEAYVAVLESSEREIRPDTELPFDRAMIKDALLAGLEAAEDGEETELLRAAFLALAWFQPLSEGEAAAVDAFDAEGDPEAAPAALETEETLAASGKAYAAVLARIEREAAALRAELADAGYEE
jgi:hypothetical protein